MAEILKFKAMNSQVRMVFTKKAEQLNLAGIRASNIGVVCNFVSI